MSLFDCLADGDCVGLFGRHTIIKLVMNHTIIAMENKKDALSQLNAFAEERAPLLQKVLLDSSEVCRLMGVSKRTLQDWRTKRKLVFVSVGKKYYYRVEDVVGLLK